MRKPLTALLTFASLLAMVGVLPAAGQGVITDDEDFGNDPPIVDETNFGSKFIRIEPQIIDLGEIHRGEKFTRTVKLTNITYSPVSITRVFSSCGCAQPEVPTEPIEPGETIEVEIEYIGRSVGRAVSPVRFFLSESRGDVRVHIRAIVRSPIEVDPPVYRAETAENQTIKVVSTDGAEFRIMAVDPPVVDGLDRERRMEHTLVIDAAKLREAGRRGHSLRIYTDHQRVDSLLVRSDRLDVLPQVLALLNWAKGDGEIDGIAELIDMGVDINDADPQGRTALMIAAQTGNYERVFTLLEFGADVNHRTKDSQTALMKAAQATKGSQELVQLLLDAGSDINARDAFSRTALHWAARTGDATRIRLLINRGSDVNSRGPSGATPLFEAVKSMNADAVRVLLESGGDPSIPDANSRRALDHAKSMMLHMRDEEKRAGLSDVIALLEAKIH